MLCVVQFNLWFFVWIFVVVYSLLASCLLYFSSLFLISYFLFLKLFTWLIFQSHLSISSPLIFFIVFSSFIFHLSSFTVSILYSLFLRSLSSVLKILAHYFLVFLTNLLLYSSPSPPTSLIKHPINKLNP